MKKLSEKLQSLGETIDPESKCAEDGRWYVRYSEEEYQEMFDQALDQEGRIIQLQGSLLKIQKLLNLDSNVRE